MPLKVFFIPLTENTVQPVLDTLVAKLEFIPLTCTLENLLKSFSKISRKIIYFCNASKIIFFTSDRK